MFEKIFAGVMVIAGLLTLTMLYAAVSPEAAVQSFFQETPDGAMASVVVPNWGDPDWLDGRAAHLRRLPRAIAQTRTRRRRRQQGRFHRAHLDARRSLSRRTADRSIIVDSVMVILFVIYLIFGKPT